MQPNAKFKNSCRDFRHKIYSHSAAILGTPYDSYVRLFSAKYKLPVSAGWTLCFKNVLKAAL